MAPQYVRAEQFPGHVNNMVIPEGTPAAKMDPGNPFLVTPSVGGYNWADRRHPLHKYYGALQIPTITVANVSCGVRQLYSLHMYPTYLSLLWGCVNVNRLSQYVFSDTNAKNKGGTMSNLDTARGLYTPEELTMYSKGMEPGEAMAQVIEDANGILGSVVGSQPTKNRNTSNPIRTYVWTLPYSDTGGPTWDQGRAVAYLNGKRAALEY